ncbi:S53 family peptidase [Actinokineospora cianjurensis]|uniref:Subtilase family protein n=1 Tax=Actinokineospora cianjurensis TaxID=585224 RepID=A0A421B1S9_9PSEU|nr:S53 family serine peptidase [Actinokineospora cianjurensis]RLK58355.1 subtilase family protein [Actinokineospora cianjurensis]
MTARPTRASALLVGCVALAGIAGAVPASAQTSAGGSEVSVVEGTAPAWATPSARVGALDLGQVRRVQVAVALKDPRGARELAAAVSRPGDPRHGRFWTAAQFTARFAPEQDTVDGVTGWLRGQGLKVTSVSANRHFIDVEGSVGRLQNAFRVTLSTYRHTARGKSVILVAPDRAVSVPRALRGAVAAVVGLDDSGLTIAPDRVRRTPHGGGPGSASGVAGDGLGCARYWAETNNAAVPQKFAAGRQSNSICGYNTGQVRGIYGLNSANTGAGTTVAIVGAYNHAGTEADSNRAADTFGSPRLGAGQYRAVLPPTFTDQNTCAPQAWYGEQALDVQAVHTVAPAARIVYYGASSCYTLLDAVNRAVQDNVASVISNSWGYTGESAVPTATRQQMDSIVLQAAIQGQAIVFSSGDAGDNSGGSSLGRVEADFPASHPWVTAVGGTSVAVGADNQVVFQSGWESGGYTRSGAGWVAQSDADGRFAGGAGGGRSQLFAQPDYQKGVVPDAVAQGRRAIPDIAALADAYTGIGVGYTVPGQGWAIFASGGTSAAAPLVAGLVADAQQAQGVARMGFLNAALYRLKTGISDVRPVQAGVWTPYMVGYGKVTVPAQAGSYLVEVDARPQSLQSSAGWDAVTGVGTPAAGFLTALGK